MLSRAKRRLRSLLGSLLSPNSVSKDHWLTDEEAAYLKTLESDPELSLEQKVRYWCREGFILSDLVQDRLEPDQPLTVLDAGAREAFLDTRWRGFRPDRIRFIGFEPDEEEAKKLSQDAKAKGVNCQYFGVGLWSEKSTQTFYDTAEPGASSFYEPNFPILDRWKFESQTNVMWGKEVFKVMRSPVLALDAVDHVLAVGTAPAVDFMKLNVQGAELEILKGAKITLQGVLGIQAEVSFVESYVGRPMFSDLDAYLRREGFEFFDIVAPHYLGRASSPITARQMPGLFGLYGQMVEAHALYLRDPIHLAHTKNQWMDVFTETHALKLVAIAETYHQVEYAIEILFWAEQYFRRKGSHSAADMIVEIRRLGLKRHDAYMRWHSDHFDRMVAAGRRQG